MVESAPASDSLFMKLSKTIAASAEYDAGKIAIINGLKSSLHSMPKNDLQMQYQIIRSLYEEYKTFNYDSAFLYARKLQQISYQLQRPVLIEDSKIKLGFILLSGGLFKNAFDTLHSVSLSGVPDSIKADYYYLKKQCD